MKIVCVFLITVSSQSFLLLLLLLIDKSCCCSRALSIKSRSLFTNISKGCSEKSKLAPGEKQMSESSTADPKGKSHKIFATGFFFNTSPQALNEPFKKVLPTAGNSRTIGDV
jgi:hypothetical protein